MLRNPSAAHDSRSCSIRTGFCPPTLIPRNMAIYAGMISQRIRKHYTRGVARKSLAQLFRVCTDSAVMLSLGTVSGRISWKNGGTFLDSEREWCAKHHAEWDHAKDKNYDHYRDIQQH